MKEVCDVEDKDRINYAWSYNLLFQENTTSHFVEWMQIRLCHRCAFKAACHERICEIWRNIRFVMIFLDTMEGASNLSLQVHPNQQYMIQNFAMPFTQDESYYYLDCAPEETYI